MKKLKVILIIMLIIVIILPIITIVKAKETEGLGKNIFGTEEIQILGNEENYIEKQNNTEEKNYVEGEAIVLIKSGIQSLQYTQKTANPTNNSIWNELTICDELNLVDNQIHETEAKFGPKTSSDTNIRYLHVKSEKYTTQEIIDSLKDEVYYVQPNYKYKAASVTNEPYEKIQWAIENKGQYNGKEGIDINPVESKGSKDAVIAVLDSGIDYTHEDLKDAMWKDSNGNYGYDVKNSDNDPMDDYFHGTMCAGVIAASSNNKTGITGALLNNQNIKLMSVKVLDSEGHGYTNEIIKGFYYIYQKQREGENIIAVNASIGGAVTAEQMEDQAFKIAINQVGEKGALTVCAAGNESYNIDEVSYIPAGIDSPYIVTVGSIDSSGKLSDFSNYGAKNVDLAAPGGNILSTSIYTSINSDFYTESEIKEYYKYYCNYDSMTSVTEGVDYAITASNERGETVPIKAKAELTTENNQRIGKGKSMKITIEELQDYNYIMIPVTINEARNLHNICKKICRQGKI